jgi:arabinose-5-phosphate isomerase
MDALKTAKMILKQQSEYLADAARTLGKPFSKALNLIEGCEGSVIVLGFGKSGMVGAKIAATLRSAGRPALVLSPLEALHGEMAAVQENDVAVALSSTGESDELMKVVPWLKKKGVSLIAITPSDRSSLARAADVLLQTAMPADSADSVASYSPCLTALAIGDLLGLCLLHGQDLDCARLPEAGPREALYTVADLIATRPSNPTAPENMIIKDALLELTAKGLGAITIVDARGQLSGIITDGDIRRLLQRSQGSLTRLFLTNVDTVMTRNPRRITTGDTVFDALQLMESNAITVLPVVDEQGRPAGMVHLHDLVQMGLLHNETRDAGKRSGAPRGAKNKTQDKTKKSGRGGKKKS